MAVRGSAGDVRLPHGLFEFAGHAVEWIRKSEVRRLHRDAGSGLDKVGQRDRAARREEAWGRG